MKKIFTSLLLLMAAAVTASAEMTTVWTGSHEIGNWAWDTRLELPSSYFANIADGGQMVITMSRNTEDAGDEQWFQYEITANDYVAGRDPERTAIASGDLEADGDVTITLTAEQADLLRDYGMIVNGHYVTVTGIAVESVETEEGTTVTLWEGTPVATGDWSDYVNLSYDDKPAALASAKVGDLITVTCTATGDDGHLQIANPDGWVAFDINSSTDLAASDMAQTFSYEIPDVATLELIQLNGILVRGRNIFQDGYCLRVFLLGRKAPCQGSLIDRAVFGIDSQKRIAIGRCRPGIFILLFGRKGIFRDQIIDGTI